MLLVEGCARDDLTLEAHLFGQEEGGVLPGNGIFGVAATGLQHLVEGHDSVAFLELDDILADFMDDAGDVIALVGVVGVRQPFYKFWVIP